MKILLRVASHELRVKSPTFYPAEGDGLYMPGRILMINKEHRGLGCTGVPLGTSKQDRLKGDEVRRKRRSGIMDF